MYIKEAISGELEKFGDLAQDYGDLFNTNAWLNNFRENIERFGIYNDDGRMIGGYCHFRAKHYGLSVIKNPQYTPCIGPFLKVEATNPVSVMDAWKKTITVLADFLLKQKYSIISLPLNRGIVDTQPFIWRKYRVSPLYTYLIDLTLTPSLVCDRFSAERRNDIKRAIKDGITVHSVNEVGKDKVQQLVLRTFERQSKKMDDLYLKRILFEYANDSNSYGFVCCRKSKAISAAFCVHDVNTSYYLLGGYDSEIKHHGAGPIAVLECIREAQRRGIKKFDFEGSMVPSIEKYFRGFGGVLTPYYRVSKSKRIIETIAPLVPRLSRII